MVAAVHDLLEALSSAGVTIEAHGGSLRYRPRSALTPRLLAAMKSCKAELLEVLKSPKGLGAVEALISPNAPGTQVHPIETLAHISADGESRADREFRRFERVAKPMPGGGLYCPVYGSPEMPGGIPGEQWDGFIADCGRLGKGSKA